MIRTLTCALTMFAFCAPALYADEPEPAPSEKKIIQQNGKERQPTTVSPPLFRFKGLRSPDESEFDSRLRDALTSSVDAESRRTIQQQLNGTWKYVTVIRTDDFETFEDRDVQLVIHGDLCGVFEAGQLSGQQPDRLRILTTSNPIAYTQASDQMQKIRYGKRVGSFLSYGLLRVDDDHLMLTSTPLIPKTGYMDYGNSLPDFFDGVDKIPAYWKYLPYFFPNTLSPEETRNRQVILRRVSDSTELLDRAAILKPDGEEDPLKLTQVLQQAREQEEWLKKVHLRIEARVSSLNPRAEWSPHTDETLQQAISDWREQHSQAEPADPAVFHDLIEALAAAPNQQDQSDKDGIPISVNLQAGKSVTRVGKEIIQVTDGDLSLFIDRQQGTYTVSERGDKIPYHQVSDFRFSLETMPDKATRSYTEGIVSYPVSDSAVRVHLKKPPSNLWRPGKNIPWVMTARRSRSSGTVLGVYSRSRRQLDSLTTRRPTPRLPPPPPLPTPLPPSPPDLLTYRYNTETKLVEDYKDYAKSAPGELLQYKAFSIGAVQVEQPKALPPEWFPRYFVEVFYKDGHPTKFNARRIDSVILNLGTGLSTAVPAEAGSTLVLIPSGGWPEQIKLEQNVDDVLAHARQLMQAKDEK